MYDLSFFLKTVLSDIFLIMQSLENLEKITTKLTAKNYLLGQGE